MNVVSTGNLDKNTLGLSSLNENAFSIMVACGHRVVSIEQQTASKFQVNTTCTSSNRYESCEGFMQFSISNIGVNLYLGKFNHADTCSSESVVIEDIESDNTSWREVIVNAKSLANSELSNECEKRKQVVESGYDYPCTPHELLTAKKIVRSIETLESMLDSFQKA
ncbi:hypothetical protein [Endozoicomonas sp. SCSIO W0465]|uniref:hypothetical protein n=1 Tax=Endozoicomonas sp. SCSIO W0465 TaxID=2918516 RepID=UPI002075EA73|nr:hypothetical protein [Endozoicomonas sp. SCSIO W0465]USE35837.1 hypothetical protein MJO57_27865 [Endozoicomonas sp. SCSIO W0465]